MDALPGLAPYLLDWTHLAVRWLHLIAAIAWVGASFYFVALDFSLRPPARSDEDAAREGVGGEAWEIHGGGFYRIEKLRVAPRSLPGALRWFKWEAYTTWLSGFTLLVLLYYVDPVAYLIDPTIAELSSAQAVGASVALLGVGWIVYDALSRRVRDDRVLVVAIAALVVAVTWISFRLFAARGAYIEVGAVIGTWMAANVFFVIIPGQRELVDARVAGREPDAAHGERGKQRSIHNNYLTLPVLFAMISQHFPFIYGRDSGWLVLLALMAVGVAVRHAFNLRNQGRSVWPVAAGSLFGFLLVVVVVAPSWLGLGKPASDGAEFASVQRVVAARCLLCHASAPSFPGIGSPPKGVVLDRPQTIAALARDIYEQVVLTRAMPYRNATSMTEDERALIARWFRGGAPGP